MTKKRRILLLRHQDAAERTAANLKKLGFDSIILPLSEIRLLSKHLPTELFDGVILTSPVAARTLQSMASVSNIKQLPVYCVGTFTAASAEMAGFSEIAAVENDARSLAGILEQLKPEQKLLYPCAKHISFDFAEHLAGTNIHCRNWQIYSNELTTPVPTQVSASLKATDTVFLFSKRTALHFFEIANLDKCVEPGDSEPIFIAISAPVGRTVPRKFLANTYIATEKSEMGMIDCLTEFKSR